MSSASVDAMVSHIAEAIGNAHVDRPHTVIDILDDPEDSGRRWRLDCEYGRHECWLTRYVRTSPSKRADASPMGCVSHISVGHDETMISTRAGHGGHAEDIVLRRRA